MIPPVCVKSSSGGAAGSSKSKNLRVAIGTAIDVREDDGRTTKGKNKYFNLCKSPESQRVDLASIDSKGRADVWFTSYIAVKKSVDWDEFIVDVCGSFKEDLGCRVVEDISKLQQNGALDEYLEKFEELKAVMLQRTPALPDVFFMDSFISGLKPQLKPFVKA
ncbi:hypothetical protein Cgig2_015367 [Carnegiea gigantea]|uniref:Retrotransposon gag domain-containing protein n=1 Tax=Carnegiea gigantea TaxID=171969 RepID=A0A9Q1K745_9CARY|nr:hypothetical protein Cgig2_015367 [Carnegiea gigantea]